MAIDWTRGYSCSWRVCNVDRRTWADGASLRGFMSASVERDASGAAPLIESGELHLDEGLGKGWSERYVRLSMTAVQGSERERVDVCTLLCVSSDASVDKGREDVALSGRSVLYPASKANTRITCGGYVPAGSNGAESAARMLGRAIDAPVSFSGSFAMSDHYVFGQDESVLTSVWSILSAGGFGIRIDGRGAVSIGPMPSTPSLSLDSAHARLLMPGIRRELDWSNVPNRYTVIDGDRTTTVVNDDPRSPTSTASRGYFSDVVDTSPTYVDGESVASYARRRLSEASVATDTREYKREWWPDVLPGDVVAASMRSVGVDGDMRVVKQSLECGFGIVVSERSEMEVSAWTVP